MGVTKHLPLSCPLSHLMKDRTLNRPSNDDSPPAAPESAQPTDAPAFEEISFDAPSRRRSMADLRTLLGLAAAACAGMVIAYFVTRPTTSPLPSPSYSQSFAVNETRESSSDLEETSLPATEDEASNPLALYRSTSFDLGSGSENRPAAKSTPSPGLPGEISFNRDIRPILSENCLSCHGPDAASREADLRLDTEEGATTGEHPAIVRGDAEASELYLRVISDDPVDVMPPPETKKSLSQREKELLARWIDAGADWEAHWAFLAPDAAPSETVPVEDAIDHFVDRRLADEGLSRSETADKRILVRRVYLDLTGLPPTPEEVEAFVADTSPRAYANLIDRLLASPSFGEHRARYWLDAARYGDTHGLHLDNYREIWPYRDWVIDAFNRNLPFDQFTIEQIAGDLLPDATQDQIVATGFNRCNVTTSEGGAIEEEFLVRYAVDRVSTTATVWLGLTAECAQCHDHKYDPITMTDFYQLFAFFNNTSQPGMDGNSEESPPAVRVYADAETEARARKLESEIAAKNRDLAAREKEIDPAGVAIDQIAPPLVDPGSGETPHDLGDVANFSADTPFTVSFRYKLPDTAQRTVLVERLNDDGRGWRIAYEDRCFLVELVESEPNRILKRGTTRRFRSGSGGHLAVTYDGSGFSKGLRLFVNGDPLQSRFVNQWFDTLQGDFASPGATLKVGGSDPGDSSAATVTEFFHDDRRLSSREIKALADFTGVRSIANKPAEKRDDKEEQRLRAFVASYGDTDFRSGLSELERLEVELSRIHSASPWSLVMNEKSDSTPAAHLLIRGEYEQKGERVEAGFPSFLPGFGEDLPKNRLGLARWLVHPENPLTARVIANRVWQELFGVGLVKTAEDFGVQGESPSHPALLDWLALHFIESGWDVKQLYRTILLSDTYRQSSKLSADLARRDPENRLLARGPRFRLDAEVIRDQALAASGLLVSTMGGPGVRPYQPAGIWSAVGYSNSNTQTFFQDFGSGAEHRRSVYTFWKRTAPPPNLSIFDAPNRESCTVRRERTNTPLQALVLMNDPHFVRAARHLAKRAVTEENADERRFDRIAQLVRARPLSDHEETVVRNSFNQFLNTYRSDPDAARALLTDDVNAAFTLASKDHQANAELAAWTMVASQFLNLDEALNKN